MAASPTGRRPPASREAGLSRLSPSAEPGRARPSAAEPGRTACPSRRRRRPASERPRGGGGAPGGGGARSPQTARGRGHRVAPRRERPAEAAWPRGRVGGGKRRPDPPAAPTARPRALSPSRRPASRCPGPCGGRAPGSAQARDCRWTSPLPRNH